MNPKNKFFKNPAGQIIISVVRCEAMPRLIAKIICLALILCFLNSCSKKDGSGNKTEVKTENEVKKVIDAGFSFASKEDVIYQAFEDYIINAGRASEPPVKFTFTVADWDVEKQASDIMSLIGQKVDVIVMMPQDSKAIVESIKAAHKAGIPVMTYNRAAWPFAEEKADAHVGLDTVDQAYTTAIALFELMKKDGVTPRLLNVMGDLRDENAVNRDKGLKKAAEERGISVVYDIETDWNPDKAYTRASNALKEHPDINAVFVASDFLMQGVRRALFDAGRWEPYGKEGHMYLGSQDVNTAGAELLKERYIDVDTAFDIWPMSTAAVDTIVKLAQKRPVNKSQLIKGRIFYHQNILTEQNVWANDYRFISWKK